MHKKPKSMSQEEFDLFCAKSELLQIQYWFKKNDWKVNKIVIGEWSQDDPRWQEYLKERAIKRARQDELLLMINAG